jgi:hypothetical protein
MPDGRRLLRLIVARLTEQRRVPSKPEPGSHVDAIVRFLKRHDRSKHERNRQRSRHFRNA